jgi:predicted DCC family thiol-disulfide oxidoreductase YuxK
MVDDGIRKPQLTLLYDGTCGFCARTVAWIQRRDRHQRIVAMPCQGAVRTGSAPVTLEDCGKSFWAITADSEVKGLGQGAALIVATLLDRTWPIAVARLPGIRQALDLGYRFIAHNRHRLPGIKGMCAVDAGSDCRS